MLALRVLPFALIAALVGLPAATRVDAADSTDTKAKVRKKVERAPSVASPVGAKSAPGVKLDASYDATKIIKEYTNELGQKVHWIAASHFDLSPPLREMATAGAPDSRLRENEPSDESPKLPPRRIVRSGVPDPVVQAAVQPTLKVGGSGVALAAPAVGFNFDGTGMDVSRVSDSNGSVGGNQFVETVNELFQVWSLNRTTMAATSILGPVANTTLWAGFGGLCEDHAGDPVVIFDKTARRWVISRLTNGGTTCVAVSTSPDATGTYARYEFATPGAQFVDYPKINAWPPTAYFMSAHGLPGGTPDGNPYDGLFAAMDRTKMLAGDPTATMLVIKDPVEAGHMAADLDGFALPPTAAPGVFVATHPEGMYVYRMSVNFNAGVASRTLQAIVPVAPWSPACDCIPQPGTDRPVGALGTFLMFRAAYRNFIDHESLVVTQSVDPSVSGVESGVRWYDVRLSGPPDATCPTYPCMYQQGTIADVPNGRSRFFPSIAMDTAENILVGYNTSGKTDGSENHSSRFSGRAKGDPPGVMTVPETTIVTGTANILNDQGRFGDYYSMSSDPADDCTFWFVSQYYTTADSWSTRIASAVFPAGTGPGQCPVTTCSTRPASQPTGTSASVPGNNQITLSWTGITPRPGAYAVERAQATCGNPSILYKPLAAVPGLTTTFTDTTVQGGFLYSYRVRAAADAAGKCQALLAGSCASATATGNCTLKPTFKGVSTVASAGGGNCGLTLSWTPATSGCPLTPGLRYNVHRGTAPDFVPSPSNRIATCVTGSSYLDTDNLQSGVTYDYAVHAEDTSTGNGGACGGGNEEANTVVASGTPYGAGFQTAPGSWTDGGGDVNAFAQLNVTAGTDPAEKAWRFVKTADDPGANHTPGGAYAYRNAGPAAENIYANGVCAELRMPPVTAAGSTVDLQYWERHQVEYLSDAVAVEYAVNGGIWNDVPPPSNSEASGCAVSDDTTGWEPLCPSNDACGFFVGKVAFSGPFGGGTSCADYTTSGTVGPYARRCHPITGLSPGDTVRFRWRSSSDLETAFAGFYLDDVAVTNVRLPNACAPDTCAGQSNGTGCDDGNACTAGDVCGSGVCTSGTPITAPTEASGMTVAADKNTYSWSALPTATRYDVVRGSLGALPVGPGGGDETCFPDLTVPSLTDATLPAPGSGVWYLSRGKNTCGIGTYGSGRATTTCP